VATVEHIKDWIGASSPGEAGPEPELTVSVVIPCLNEAENVERCVSRARSALTDNGLDGEVIVVDNASTDASADLAAAAGARVIRERRRGYGNAYLAGFAAARGRYIVMADADLTYDFEDIPRFLERLESGAALVMGDRMGDIRPGAMHWLHRYVGNPILTGLLNLFYRAGVRDAHCGMRAVRRDALETLDLRATGMELASEMVVRAAREGLRIDQIPIAYHPRGGQSKLLRYRDGWRHVRFLLVHSPTHLFVIPGVIMTALGGMAGIAVLAALPLFGRQWSVHALIAGSLLVVLGVQIVALGLCAHAYGAYVMDQRDPWFDRMRRRFRLEHGLLLGGGVAVAGLVVAGVIGGIWLSRGFGRLSEEKLAVVAATLITVGVQIFFASFLLSILGLRAGTAQRLGARRPSVTPAPPQARSPAQAR